MKNHKHIIIILILFILILFTLIPFNVSADPTGVIDNFIMERDGQKIVVPLNGTDGYAFGYSTQNALYQYLKGSYSSPFVYGVQSVGKYMPLNGLGGYAMNYSLYSTPLEAMNNTSEISESEIDTFYMFNGFDSSGEAILKPVKDVLTVTFKSNGGSAVAPIAGIAKSSTVSLPTAPTKRGYLFGGWFTDDITFSNAFTSSTPITASIIVYAKWKPASFTVSFNSNGGSIVDTIEQDYNTMIIPPVVPTRVGYIFGGWLPNIPDKMPAENIIIDAQWEIISYTLTYTASDNGRITGTATQMVDYGSNGKEVLAVPNEGYHFTKWSDDSTKNPRTDTNVNKDVTVVAEFSINQYTVECINPMIINIDLGIYNIAFTKESIVLGFPGITTTDNLNVNIGAEDYIAIYTPHINDIDGPGWLAFNIQGFGETQIKSGIVYHIKQYTVESFSLSIVNVTSGIYNMAFSKETIESRFPGITTADNLNVNIGAENYIAVYFSHIIDFDGPGWLAFNIQGFSETEIKSGALSRLNRYTIIFNTNGGSEITPITQDYKTSVTVPTNPTKAGYAFSGWSPLIPNTIPIDGLTVIAQWEKISYTLTYIASDNGRITGTATQAVDYGSSGTEIMAVPNEGYHFAKWSDDSTANPRTDTNVNTDITITAIFSSDQYTVEGLNPNIINIDLGIYNIAFSKQGIESRFPGITITDNLNINIGAEDYIAIYTPHINDIDGPGWLAFNIQGFSETEIKAGMICRVNQYTVESFNLTIINVTSGIYNIAFVKEAIELRFSGITTTDNLSINIGAEDYIAVYFSHINDIDGPGWLTFNIQGFSEIEIEAGIVTRIK